MNPIEIEYKNTKDTLLNHKYAIDLVYRLFFINGRSVYERVVIFEKKRKTFMDKNIFGFAVFQNIYDNDFKIDSKTLDAYNKSLNNDYSTRVYAEDFSRRLFLENIKENILEGTKNDFDMDSITNDLLKIKPLSNRIDFDLEGVIKYYSN